MLEDQIKQFAEAIMDEHGHEDTLSVHDETLIVHEGTLNVEVWREGLVALAQAYLDRLEEKACQ